MKVIIAIDLTTLACVISRIKCSFRRQRKCEISCLWAKKYDSGENSELYAVDSSLYSELYSVSLCQSKVISGEWL